jgi:hypothetical protein
MALGTDANSELYFEQGLLWSGRAPAALASASVMYFPFFVVP